MILGFDGRFANYPKRAGIGNYSLGLLRALAARADTEHRLRIYVDEALHRHFPGPAPHVEICVLPRKPAWTQRILARELAAAAPDVYFSPITQLPWRCPCPSLVAVLDLAFLDFPGEFTALRRLRATVQTRDVMRRATRLVAISQATAQAIHKHFPRAAGRVEVIYPGCDPAFRADIPREAVEIVRARHTLPEPYLLYVGRIQPRKNLVRLTEAFACVKRQHPELPHQLVLAGDTGWLEQETLDAVRHFPDFVRRLGFVEQADLPALISGADALVLVSRWEGFGLPALEALACGVPVLGSNNSALPEVCGDAGLLVDPESDNDIAAAIYRILTEPSLRGTLRLKGPSQAAKFSWDDAAVRVFHAASATLEN